MTNHPELGPTRLHVVSTRVPTQFGSLYAHVGFDDGGRAREVTFSAPGKHGDTAIDDALAGLARAVTGTLAEVAS